MNIITGYRGEPHITSDQDRAKNEGAFGTGMYILDVGDQLAAEVISANEIRIRDGVLCMNGCVANITEGAYDSCEISNGTQGMQRRDLIVARYTKDAETNIEDISLVVIEGTPAASSPSDPSYNNGDIQQGDSPVDFPLYRVNINGVNVSGTTLLASKVRTQAETDTLLGSTSISGIGGGTVTGAISKLNSNLNGMSLVKKNVYAGYSTTFTFSGDACRAVIFAIGLGSARNVIIANMRSSAIGYDAVLTSSLMPISVSGTTMTIANNSTAAIVLAALVFEGTLS